MVVRIPFPPANFLDKAIKKGILPVMRRLIKLEKFENAIKSFENYQEILFDLVILQYGSLKLEGFWEGVGVLMTYYKTSFSDAILRLYISNLSATWQLSNIEM